MCGSTVVPPGTTPSPRAHRGEEISGEVLDGKDSLALTQGAMTMAVLESPAASRG
jgi:hypothetical protein